MSFTELLRPGFRLAHACLSYISGAATVKAADLWLFISTQRHLHPLQPPTDGLRLFTQGEQCPKKPVKYNKQGDNRLEAGSDCDLLVTEET